MNANKYPFAINHEYFVAYIEYTSILETSKCTQAISCVKIESK